MYSDVALAVKAQDLQCRLIHLLEYRCRPARYRQDQSVCQAGVLVGPNSLTGQ